MEAQLGGTIALTPQEWHTRFLQQAGWTREMRDHLFAQLSPLSGDRVLEIGCGTGALLAEMHSQHHPAALHGLDINPQLLALAAKNVPQAALTLGDAHSPPYPARSFDLVCCHYLLLWVRDPQSVVQEMARLLRPGGTALALAEPDYGGRIDYPPELEQLGRWQSRALREQGADPHIGRRLRSIFHQASLHQVEIGVLGGQWRGAPSSQDREAEWAMLEYDLAGRVPEDKLKHLRQLDDESYSSGERVLFVPTFYAAGRAGG